MPAGPAGLRVKDPEWGVDQKEGQKVQVRLFNASTGRALLSLVIACSALARTQARQGELQSLREDAEAAASRGEWAEAASLFGSAISADQNAVWAYQGLGDVYRANGAWDKAVAEYNAAAGLDPQNDLLRQLASFSRQALEESRSGFVTAATLRGAAAIPWAWSKTADAGSRAISAATAQRLPLQVAFPRDQFALPSLPASAVRQLEEVAALISANWTGDFKIEIEGHTCRCGTASANLELGRKRAEAIRDFLIKKGVTENITTISFGSARPVDSPGAPSLPAAVCERDEIHSRNRRVVIVVYGEAKPLITSRSLLEVSFLARHSGGRTFELLSDGAQLHAGDNYRLRLQPRTTVFAYAFHRGSSGKWDVLFPEEDGGRLTNPLESKGELETAPVDADFDLNEKPGTEETYVYVRKERDSTLEALINKIRQGVAVSLLPPVLEAKDVKADASERTQSPKKAIIHKAQAGQATSPEPEGIIEGQKVITTRDLSPHREDSTAQPIRDGVRLPPYPAAHLRFEHVN
jgi:outer membrane protein OmpA-like peptidoglycan-associated protein